MKSYQDFCHAISDRLLNIIETNDILTWRKNWVSSGSGLLPASKNGRYRGANLLNLLFEQVEKGFSSNYWLTFKQVNALGGQVKKGASSTKAFFWKMIEKKEEEEIVQIPVFKTYSVFNLDQTTLQPENFDCQFEQKDSINELLERKNICISHFGGRAYYEPNNDVIVLPDINRFYSEESYYATLLHEVTHWSGAEIRLSRQSLVNYSHSNIDRAEEELVAEIGALLLAAHFGVNGELENHAAYVKGWKKILTTTHVARAINNATKAFEWLLIS